MKQIRLMALVVVFALFGVAFTGCSDDDDNGDIRVESVTLSDDIKDGIRLFVDETLDISGKVTVNPSDATDKKQTYSSSVPTIASISEAGVITAIAEGKTTVTVTVDGKTANVEVNVVEKDTYVAVTDVILPNDLKDGADIFVGQTLDIAGKVTIVPENATIKTESYDSSDKDVATVSDAGLVSAIGVGTSEITVTVDGKSATFTLTATLDVQHVAVTEVKVSQADASVQTGASIELAGYVTVLPEDATNKAVSYTSSDEKVATVDANGKVTGIGFGTATITVTSVDNAEAKATIEVDVIFPGGDYDRTGWVISDHFPRLYKPTDQKETNTADFLFEDSNTDGYTYFGLIKVGSSWVHETPNIVNKPEEGGGWMHFTIDTGKPHKINYFRFAYRDGLNHLRYMAIEKIYGSNDGEEFFDITTDVTPIPGWDSTTNESGNAPLPTTTYRYYKFWCQQMYGVCFPQTNGASGQVRKIWMGYDPALDE